MAMSAASLPCTTPTTYPYRPVGVIVQATLCVWHSPYNAHGLSDAHIMTLDCWPAARLMHYGSMVTSLHYLHFARHPSKTRREPPPLTSVFIHATDCAALLLSRAPFAPIHIYFTGLSAMLHTAITGQQDMVVGRAQPRMPRIHESTYFSQVSHNFPALVA